ncbi:ABC transporter permease [Anaerosporobacter faecicola]|uniref:ABC transporter permease n=1 Tax=Anaerosporobacter faecicola TaxID=2718714 RepID=UPI001439B27C|nr:ABC transporter permease [Anaerosporobacter faecicola]
MRGIVFAKRTLKEIVRDPLSYIFCVGFPIVMLIIMTIVNESIPAQAAIEIFQIQNLAPGIACFGLTFIMLFTCLQVSKDRSTAFLIRLYVSPMKPGEFVAGYTYPVILIAVLQSVITFIAAMIIGQIKGYHFEIQNILLCMVVLLPSALLFIGFGLFFATLLNEKAAPGICSIIISAACMIGGIWMDVDSIGGTLEKICKVFPFYHGVAAARFAIRGEYSKLGQPLLIILVYAVVIYLLATFVFRKKMQSDVR